MLKQISQLSTLRNHNITFILFALCLLYTYKYAKAKIDVPNAPILGLNNNHILNLQMCNVFILLTLTAL